MKVYKVLRINKQGEIVSAFNNSTNPTRWEIGKQKRHPSHVFFPSHPKEGFCCYLSKDQMVKNANQHVFPEAQDVFEAKVIEGTFHSEKAIVFQMTLTKRIGRLVYRSTGKKNYYGDLIKKVVFVPLKKKTAKKPVKKAVKKPIKKGKKK
jgi:hypothetical protein